MNRSEHTICVPKLLCRVIAASAALSTTMPAHAEKALEEVIVTAQKKDDTLQTVPMTVNAVTSETIAKYNLLDFKDIQAVTPGLTIRAQDNRTSTIAIRGVNVLTDSGFGPGVAIYWNEVNYDIDSAFKAMYDIGQIEVLRGPQGTLRGITAPAGAVTITTKRPSFSEIEGTVEQTFGERNLSNTQFGLSLPIVEDKLALRVAGLYDHNQTDGIKNIPTGKTNSAVTRSGRVTLELRPNDNLDIALIHQYQEGTTSGQDAVIGCGTGSNIQTCLDKSDRKSVISGPVNTTLNRRADTALNIEWNLGDYTLTSITGYRDQGNAVLSNSYDFGNAQPATTALFGNPIPADQQFIKTALHTLTQELRFATNDAEFYNWTYGLYTSKIVSSTFVSQTVPYAYYFGGSVIDLDAARYDIPKILVSSEEYGAFTNQSFQFTDALEAQIGLRYQSKRNVTSQPYSVSYNPAEAQAIGAPFIPPYYIFPGAAPKSAVDEGVTGTASIAYQLTDDVRIYTSYGRSFRAGGFTVASTGPQQLAQYQPETSDSIELGVKSRFADGRIQLNADIYYQKYQNYLALTQSPVTVVNTATGVIGTGTPPFNADAVAQGAEMQIDALLTDDWQVGLGVSYVDAKFTGGKTYCDFVTDASCTDSLTDSNGNRLVGTRTASGRLAGEPNWGVSANTEYTLHFGAVDAYARGLYSFQSGRSDDAVANSVLDTSSYGIFNLFLGVRDTKKVWEVNVWAKNLFDHQQVTRIKKEELYQPSAYNFSPNVPPAQDPNIATGYSQVQLIPERQIGITGKYNFSL